MIRTDHLTLPLLIALLALVGCSDTAAGTLEESAAPSALTLEPIGESQEDAGATNGRAAALLRTNERARFELGDVQPGAYEVHVRARGDLYEGWPVMRLLVDNQQFGEDVLVESSRYLEYNFGEFNLSSGQVLEAVFTNDNWDGSKDKDRNLIVDTLVLEPAQTSVKEEPTDGVTVSLGESRRVEPDLFGFNNDQTIRGIERDDRAYNEALGSLSPGTLRFPGGTMANYWDWEQADFVCDKGGTYQLFNGGARPCALPNGYQSLNPPRHGLEHFKTELDRTGANAVFVLNILTKRAGQTESHLDIALRMLKEAERLGIKVKYLELGNEFYLSHGNRDASNDYQVAFPTAEAYAREAQRWIEALRKDFPNAQISVVGADRRYQGGKRRNTWNERVLKTLAGQADALSIHTYAGAGGSTAAVLGMPQKRMGNLQKEFDALPQDLPLWITEYNLFERENAVHGTWAHGLFAAAQTLSLLQEEDVALMHFHSGVGNAVFGALFRNESGFGYGGSSFPAPGNPPKTVPFAKTASGQTLQLIGDAMRGATSAQPLNFGDGAPQLSGTQSALVGWRFGNESILLNLSGDEETLNMPGALQGGAFTQRSAAPTTRITGKAGEVNEVRGDAGGTLRLPAHSITHLR